MEASDVLVWVAWVFDVSAEVGSTVGAFVWAFEGGSWVPLLCCDAFVVTVVQTLVASFAEFKAQWPACLTVGESVGALEEVVWVVSAVVVVFVVSISFSFAQGVWAWDSWWCGTSDLYDLEGVGSYK